MVVPQALVGVTRAFPKRPTGPVFSGSPAFWVSLNWLSEPGIPSDARAAPSQERSTETAATALLALILGGLHRGLKITAAGALPGERPAAKMCWR